MSALRKEGNRIRLYGWVEVSGNATTSSDTNYPLTYGFIPNRAVLNQAVLTLERQPDTMQKSHVDWGFHLSDSSVRTIATPSPRATAATSFWHTTTSTVSILYGNRWMFTFR